MTKYSNFLFFYFLVFGCRPAIKAEKDQSLQSETLSIQKVTDHVYQHTSYLNTENFGKVPCNGMIVFDKKEAIIFDTAPDNKTSLALITWVENHLDCKIKAIIPTHFHADCLGGLAAFHDRGIPSYAHNLTINLAKEIKVISPQNGFDGLLELKVGEKIVLARFFGEGHTPDNVVGYFPPEKVLFGGCLIKELGAGKGNLEDANIQAWPTTVARLKETYPDTKMVIPGHGKAGGTELFDFTIRLFKQN
jgi:metallo-beta-lactamase class B